MQVSVQLTYSTAEASAAAMQTIAAFGEAFRRAGGAPSGSSELEHLVFCLTIAHPLTAPRSARASGSYNAGTHTFYSKASLNYAAWITADWPSRVEAVGLALTASAAAIHKTRITEQERTRLSALIAEVQRQVASDPPMSVIRQQPVQLTFLMGRSEPIISFGHLPYTAADSQRTTVLPPEKIDEYLLNRPAEPSDPRPKMFKLYKRSEVGVEYREAWPADGVVIEHWGVCGERGVTCEHSTPTARDQLTTLKQLKAKSAALGFKPIPISRHVRLVVQRSVAGAGTLQDLDERRALEAFLDELTGWLGLGHCDGGSMGSGAMEAFCFVVDARIARAALSAELAKSRFSAFEILAHAYG